jgi:menaquinone-dependent protoporphyrinogen IX oxidase
VHIRLYHDDTRVLLGYNGQEKDQLLQKIILFEVPVMKAIVIYKSKSGFTQKYAEWIAQELKADICEAAEVNICRLVEYETVIYGGGLYAVGINGIKLITKNLDKLKGKKVIVFATGASPFREEVLDEVKNSNFTPEQQKQIKFFYLRGGFDYSKLTAIDKVLMTLLKLKIKMKKKSERVPDEIGMLAAYKKPMDFTKRKNIEGVISYVHA